MENAPAVVPPAEVVMKDGLFAPDTFDGMWRLATLYAGSGIVPKHYNNNPAAIMVAGQYGASMGLELLPALQGIAVINGNPSLWGDVQMAVVRNSGTVETFVEYHSGIFPNDDFMAVCIAKRKGVGGDYDPEMSIEMAQKIGLFVNMFSVADAKTAGLWKKVGPWTTNPKRMLKMRARAFTLRDGWPDFLKGMHSVEEMIGADVEMVEQTRGEFVPYTKTVPEPNGQGLDIYKANDVEAGELVETKEPEQEVSIDTNGGPVQGNPVQEIPEDQKAEPGPEINWWDDRSNWINTRTNEKFVERITHEKGSELLLAAKPETIAEVKAKWLRFGNDLTKFPGWEYGSLLDDDPPIDESESINLTERLSAVPDDIKTKAAANLKCSVSPMTDNGKRILLDECNKLDCENQY